MEPPQRVSYTGLMMRGFNDLKHNKQQWYRHVLGLCAAFHVTPNVGKLYWHYSVGEVACVPPDFLAFVLSIAARFCWIFLFREPETYLGLRRPQWTYKAAVAWTIISTTLPNGVVHVWALKAAWEGTRLLNTGLISATLAMLVWIPLTGLVWWMGWRFLLRPNDEDADFEPAVEGSIDPGFAPYADEPQGLSSVREVSTDYLAQAYENQHLGRTLTLHGQRVQSPRNSANPSGNVPDLRPHGTEVASTLSETQNRSLQCQTVARFDYMPQNHSGGYSWFFQPLLPFILTIYATLTMGSQLLLIYEERLYKLRTPSPSVKQSLFLPLGAYLLAFYALKHRVRISQFLKVESPLPGAWQKTSRTRLFRHLGFRNLETGETCLTDPRRRAFPGVADQNLPSILDSQAYLTAYNASPRSCDSYWGHLGRLPTIRMRISPPVLRIGFLVLALYLVFTGWLRTVFHTVINPYEEMVKHGERLTPEVVAIIWRSLRVWQFLLYVTFGLVVICLLYALLSMLAVVVLWGKTVLDHTERGGLVNDAQGGQGGQGQIRLD